MINGITLGIIMIIILLLGAFILSLLINAFLIPLFKTPKDVLQEIVDIMDLKREDSLVDLGSGDGRILFKAFRQSSCKCLGYDISPIMLIIAKTKKALQFPFTKDILFETEDIYKVNLKEFTKIYCYLDTKSLKILRKKFEAFVKNGGEIYSYAYPIDSINNQEKIILSNNIPLYIYKK
jgi:SAM-dependent methyltransferase